VINANLLVLFRQDATNLKHIFNDHVAPNMLLQQFTDMCNVCWNQSYDFMVIDKECALLEGRYRRAFDAFFCHINEFVYCIAA
jgi:hypothetical protein